MLQGAALQAVIGLVVTLGFALLAVALGTLLVAPTRQDLANRRVILRYGAKFIGVGVVMSLLSTGILVGFAVWAEVPASEWRWGMAVFGTLTALSHGMLFEGFRRRVTLDDDGISVRGWLGTKKLARWDDVVRVENKVASSKFVVRTPISKVSISHHLGGLDWFADVCRARLAPEVYGAEFDKPLNRHLGF